MTVHPPLGVPDVTVVVIAYDDVDNLSTAVESVLNQTLRNLEVIVVDDASSDGTGEVATRLAAEHGRVRAVHLPENSGGCSRPRNVGLEQARAPYVMFLDSDDVYERHACKNLLLEAERTGADVVAGQCVRNIVGRDKVVPWFTKLYAERAVFAGIRENPELFFDPLSTNKLYRRAFLDEGDIRFPEGVHYEDSLFTTKVYCQAGTIAIIPNVVYYWNVVPDGEARSITQRRFEFENFRDRIAVHRMMDAYLSSHGAADLKSYKDFKFIRHDLALYLNDLPARDDEYQRRFMRLAADYLSTFSDETLEMVDPVERVCVFMLRHLDIQEALKAIDYLRHGFKLSTELVERDGHVYWTAKYLDTPQDRAAMDVTVVGLHRMPFKRQSLYNEVTEASIVDGRLLLHARLLNQLDRISPSDDLRLEASVSRRGRRRRHRFAVTDVRHEGRYIRYSADIDLARGIGAFDPDVLVWDLRLHVHWNGAAGVAKFSVDPAKVTGQRVRLRPRFKGAVAGTLEPYVTTKGNLALEQVGDAVPAVTVQVHAFTRRARNAVRWRWRRAVTRPAAKVELYRLLQRLPVKPGLTVFESHMGKQYSDNPKYVYEAARKVGFDELGITPVWSCATRRAGFPKESRLVRRNSWRYYYLLARAQYWVDNQGFPRVFTKRRETTYLQTWHGTPLKTMGWDEPALAQLSSNARRSHEGMIDRWDYLVAPSEYFVDTFARAYRYDGKLLRVGYPRNDLLVNRSHDEAFVKAMKQRLGLPLDRTIVLYAPTFRDRDRRKGEPFVLPFHLRSLGRALSDDVFVLLRTHYLDRLQVTRRHAPYARNVSGYDDMTELMLVADVLVTDYSSTMFDYANTGRPMIFYTHDYDEYVHAGRGTYFDLAVEAPGPLVTTTDELVAALSDLGGVRRDYADRYARWRQKFCEYDEGHAAADVVAEVFGPGGRS